MLVLKKQTTLVIIIDFLMKISRTIKRRKVFAINIALNIDSVRGYLPLRSQFIVVIKMTAGYQYLSWPVHRRVHYLHCHCDL